MAERSVLLVEDDDTLVRAIARNLSVRGYAVRSAMTVREALALVEKEIPDVAILDVDLPDGSGWDVLRILRANAGEFVPVIVMSALRPNARLTKELQCSSVLEKPFPMESLLRLVAENVERLHGPAASGAQS